MSDRKVIAVVGATGAQGGGLVRAILADPDGGFAARALTRDPSSDKAKALAELGAEVVRADLDDEASLEAAFAGAYGAYCLTNFWEHFSADKEIEQAAKHGRRGEDRRPQARDLVDLRGHAQVDPARRRPHADAPGEVQGGALRRQGRRPTTSSPTWACRRRSS